MKECLDIFISDEDRLIVESVRNFVNKEIIPVREDIEKDKEHKMKRLSAVEIFLISEEVARGDVGIAVAQAATRWGLSAMMLGKNKVLMDRFLPIFCEDEPHLACFAMTEESSGCDKSVCVAR